MEYSITNLKKEQLNQLLNQRIKELDSLRKKYVKVLRKNLELESINKELENKVRNAKILINQAVGTMHGRMPKVTNDELFPEGNKEEK